MEKTVLNNKKIIKIGVLLAYGTDNASLLVGMLRCENTEEKLQAIHNIDNLTITPEQKLFVIQKLLSYPKVVRFSIASQLESAIEEISASKDDC